MFTNKGLIKKCHCKDNSLIRESTSKQHIAHSQIEINKFVAKFPNTKVENIFFIS